MDFLVVKKFGGSSLSNSDKMLSAAARIMAAMEEGAGVAAVVSAQGLQTDMLINKARGISASPSPRELDMLLATGEQQSASLLAMAVEKLGGRAVSLNAQQAGVLSTGGHGDAKIEAIDAGRLRRELASGKAVIVAGFQGMTAGGDVATLGRGASDTTAVALAAVLGAARCEMYTDVDGIYTADPRVVSGAIKLRAICYDDMLELAASGVKKPHGRAVDMAKRYGVPVYVRSSLNDSPGTWIKEDVGVERLVVSGIAVDRNIARIVVRAKKGAAVDFRLLLALAERGIAADHIALPHRSCGELVFTVRKQDARAALDILAARGDELAVGSASADEGLAKFSVVGAGMLANCGIAAKVLGALGENGIKIEMVAASETKLSVLVDENQATLAARCAHDCLMQDFEAGLR